MRYRIAVVFSFLVSFLQAQEKPNILWIVCEDISPILSFYGDKTAKTPNLDALASESLIYDNAFATTPVCGPSRSAIITGMLPSSIGTMHMRTGRDIQSWGNLKYKDTVYDPKGQLVHDLNGNLIREYSAVIPENVKCFTEYLRANNYYCTNNQKTDYQFAAPQSAWDENSKKAHWKNTPSGMPFFSVFNFEVTHESRIWLNKDLPLTVHPKDVPVPDYYPDNDIIRNDLARLYSNVELLDIQVGKIIAELKKDGLYDNTIIFFYSDHGGPLPRQKREIYDSGLKVPFMIRFPNAEKKGRTSELVSFADLAPTMLSLANIKPPKYMDGQAFLGNFKAKEREVIYATSDRFDEFTDRIRIVRDKQFLYVKNYHLELPKYKNVSYRFNIPMMHSIMENKENNQLNTSQNHWFQPKSDEELYDCINDPFQLNNLASNPKYANKLKELRILEQKQFISKIDFGKYYEADLIQKMWPNGKQPKTNPVKIDIKGNKIVLKSQTEGASISYLLVPRDSKEKITNNSKWKLFVAPIVVPSNFKLLAKADRIGFEESEISEYN
ncbi:sulfatase-like hydrolase/transferase [Flavobacterium sp. LMO8]|uniref:sulfatase family protein n=1 Tax=Flavobacterium sp. LMO8 TaxID=2654244 RepID=UPI0012922FD4|nr:sulfatase [Flavobacterium sp. LMO8]MQP25662.1 sulfatase-like hydrolase/transferase [Flavobacterium sp. LMO8]